MQAARTSGMKAIYLVVAASVVALGIFISVSLDGAQKTVPKIKLSYFTTPTEIAEAMTKRLNLEVQKNKSFWLGLEPEKNEHIPVAAAIKAEIEKLNGAFDEVIVDSELRLTPEDLNLLKTSQNVLIKENLTAVGDVLTNLKLQNKKYLVVTASLYTNSFIKENPIHILNKKYGIDPMTVSFGYFAANADEEKNILFPCDTEDKSGASNWGCAVVNKARVVRRKFEKENKKPWSGLMDLTGENDYMLLIRKQ